MTSDMLAALLLQMEWGADEALGETAVDRFLLQPPAAEAPTLAHAPLPAAARAPALPRPAPPPALLPLATTIDELHAALSTFEGCALRLTATHTVRPDGNPRAGLVVIGDAPGSEDDRSGRAFSGPAGAVLDLVFGSAGLDRSAMLLTTIVPWRPPGGRPLAEPEYQACLPFALRLLTLLRPRLLLLLGLGTVRALTGTAEPIRRLRGRWLDVTVPEMSLPVPALAMPPPDQWLRNPASKQDVWAQVLLLRRTVSSP